jgi:hypothetical protein
MKYTLYIMRQFSKFMNVFMMLMVYATAFTLHVSDEGVGGVGEWGGYGSGGMRCDVCDLSVIAIEDYLDSNHTLTELEQSLDLLCSKTPLSTTCTNLVNSYLPQIIAYLKQKENPQTICNQLGFCSTVPSIHYKYDFCNSLFRLYTNIHQNKMNYFSNDCTSYNCTKTALTISKHVYSYLHTFVMKYNVCNGIILPL